jgi:hypothetical protein
MKAWLKSLFTRKPKWKPFTVYWAESKHIPGEPLWIDGVGEFETGVTFIHQHCQTYEADCVETAVAMHRSDYPGTTPTSVVCYAP